MSDEDIELIDKYLELISPNRGKFILHDVYSEHTQITHRTQELEYITKLFDNLKFIIPKVNSSYFELSEEAIKIIEEGGYKRYHENKQIEKLSHDEDRQLIRLLNQSTLKTNKSIQELNSFSKNNSIYQGILALFTFAVAVFSTYIAFRQSETNKVNNEKIELLESSLKDNKENLSRLQSLTDSLLHSHPVDSIK